MTRKKIKHFRLDNLEISKVDWIGLAVIVTILTAGVVVLSAMLAKSEQIREIIVYATSITTTALAIYATTKTVAKR